MRRRLRYLQKARELAYRDLGGLVFDLHRFGQRHDELVLAKLTTLGHIDAELRTLHSALGEGASTTVLREAGIAACPRCAAIHGSDDNFCPSCGLPMGRHADRPIGVPAAQQPHSPPISANGPTPPTPASPAAPGSTPAGPSAARPAAADPTPAGPPTVAFPANRPPSPGQTSPEEPPQT
jgi:hypothetical protein